VKKQQDLLKSNFKAEATDMAFKQNTSLTKEDSRKCRLEQKIKSVIRHSQVTRNQCPARKVACNLCQRKVTMQKCAGQGLSMKLIQQCQMKRE